MRLSFPAAPITQTDKLVEAQIRVAALLHFLYVRTGNSVISQLHELVDRHLLITERPQLLDELWVHAVVSHLS